jgi:hypothetical protein
MSLVWGLLSLVSQFISCVLFCVVSGYVLVFGLPKTGIKIDYAFFSLMCLVVFFVT